MRVSGTNSSVNGSTQGKPGRTLVLKPEGRGACASWSQLSIPTGRHGFYFWVGLFVALAALGVPLIGVTVNVWLGGAILAVAFFCIVRAFWIWEKSSKFHIVLRIATITIAAVLYFGLARRQIINQYRLDHPLAGSANHEDSGKGETAKHPVERSLESSKDKAARAEQPTPTSGQSAAPQSGNGSAHASEPSKPAKQNNNKTAKPAPAKPPSPTTATNPGPAAPTFTQNIGGTNNIGIQGEQINIGNPGRIIATDKYSGLVSDLRKLEKGTAALVVFEPITEEMRHFGGQLQKAFKEADWELPGYQEDISNEHRAVVSGSGPDGVKRNIADGMHCVGDSQFAKDIMQALKTAGVECEWPLETLYPPPTPKPTITIFLGRDLSR